MSAMDLSYLPSVLKHIIGVLLLSTSKYEYRYMSAVDITTKPLIHRMI